MPSARPKPTRGTYRMKRLRRRAATAAIAAACLTALVLVNRSGWFGSPPGEDKRVYNTKTFGVLRVIDGDTIHIAQRDTREGLPHTVVRFWGVDTPEIAHGTRPADHFGPEAASFLRHLLANASVRLELEPGRETRGKFHRLLAWVYLDDGTCVNERLLREGYGYADPRFGHTRLRAFAKLQQSACNARRGLWKDVTPKDLPDYFHGRTPLDRRTPRSEPPASQKAI